MANLLERASVVLSPTAYNNGEALCIKPDDGSGDFDFSRNSAATRVNAQGLVENVQTISGNLLDYSTFTSPSASWSLVGGLWVYDDTANGYILTPFIPVVVGDVFDVVIDVTIASGNANFRYASGNAQTTLFPFTDFVDGVNEFQATITGVDGHLERIFAPASLTDNPFTLNSISIKKISQDTNLPRINYEGGCGSWLFEPQSTNLIPYSSDFSQWSTKTNISVTLNSAISPEGVNSAAFINENSSNAQHFIGQSFSFTNGQDVTISVYAKKNQRDVLQISPSGNYLSTSGYANYDLTNGLVTASGGGVTAEIETLTNDWYRCIAKFTANNSATGTTAFFLQNSTTASRGASYQGDGTSGLYLWGAQVEALSYPTSLIPTSGSQVTRNQDVCTNGATGTGLINSTEGTLYAEIAVLANDGTARYLGLSDGTSDNRVVILYYSPINKIRFIIESEDVKYLDENFLLSDITEFHKVAISYKLNDFKVYVDGVLKINDTIGNTPIGLNVLSFDLGGSSPFFGKTKALAVWKEALSDQELSELTTI